MCRKNKLFGIVLESSGWLELALPAKLTFSIPTLLMGDPAGDAGTSSIYSIPLFIRGLNFALSPHRVVF